MIGIGSALSGYGAYTGYAAVPVSSPVSDAAPSNEGGAVVNPGESDVKQAGRRSSPAQCETCQNRKYQDGSDEMVSFKTAQHISPQEAGTRVRAHEQEHVNNAYAKAEQGEGKVLQASVQIHTAICPECGRTYVCGGTTTTKIKYGNEDNPYQKQLKALQGQGLRGANVDMAV